LKPLAGLGSAIPLLSWLALGCSNSGPPKAKKTPEVAAPHRASQPKLVAEGAPAARFLLRGGLVFGVGKRNLLVAAGRVVASDAPDDAAERVVDVSGRWLVPGFIDSHVHLAYYPEGAKELAASGIVAVLDLGAPLSALSVDHAPLKVLNAGPMLTAPAGYPLNSWGAAGYGLGVASPAAAALAVESLSMAGVQAIKVPLTAEPTLSDLSVQAIVEAAHARGLKVYSHALEEQNAARAARDGVDVLAHTPTEALSESTLGAWSERTVISTLGAFGGSVAIENLRRLRAHGTRVLYGTDFGNTQQTGVQSAEIDQLLAAGFDGAAIVKAGTSVPAEFLGLREYGSLDVGKRASFLVLAEDPGLHPQTLAEPIAVYVDGELSGVGL
jgi:imidazolonepropionase-like amidohydrolase